MPNRTAALQITNELFRQILENKAVYALEKPIGDTKNIVGTSFIGAMMQPGETHSVYEQSGW